MTRKELDAYYANLENTLAIAEAIGMDVIHQPNSKYYRTHCPGHYKRLGKIDNNPSSCVFGKNGGYHCFSCGVSRSTKEMIMEVRECSESEAYQIMAAGAGTSLTKGNENAILPPVRLSRKEADVIGLKAPFYKKNGDIEVGLYALYKKNKQRYYSMIINQATMMLKKYESCKAYSAVDAPKALIVYDMLGDNFDSSVYKQMDRILDENIATCKKIISIFTGAARKQGLF